MKLPENYVKRCRPFKEGQKRYIHDEDAVDGVCFAHILKVLPHPADEDERLIVYRWYGKKTHRWFYGVTETWKQDIWADYCKEVVENRKKNHNKR